MGTNYLQVNGHKIKVLPPNGSTMYLGRLLSIQDVHNVEIKHRLKRAWAKFMVYKKELCGKAYPLRDRLKLFEATVTPTVLYGCGCWTMTEDREKLLRCTQRRMLRWIVGVGRKTIVVGKDETGEEEEEFSEEEEPPESLDEENEEEVYEEKKTVKESWIEWVQRATHIAEHHLKKLRISDWVTKSRILKWTWAGHAARRTDGRWSTATIL